MSDSFLVGTRKGLLLYTRRGGTWQPGPLLFAGVKVPMVLRDARDGRFYAAVDHGHFGTKLHRSADGVHWEELPPPTYPERPEHVAPVRCPMQHTEIPWSLEMIWSLEAGGADEPGTLWCGTIPGGLFRSRDCGESWELIRSLWDRPERAKWFGGGYDHPGIHSICVDPRDSRKITLGISCGGVWRSSDGGGAWELVGHGQIANYLPPDLAGSLESQDPHRLLLCPGQPEVVWIQHHNGIFRSTDSGANFTQLNPMVAPDFGFAVAPHPTDAGTAWFVPAIQDEMRIPAGGKMIVTRTCDGGATFEAFGQGLPGEHAHHLVYRHALEVDRTGRQLVMGSTSGGLWVSEDAGESWTRISADLAPVFCVRWI